MDYDLLDDGTKLAKKNSGTGGATWQRFFHTALAHLQAMAASLVAIALGTVSGVLVVNGVAKTVKYLSTTVADGTANSQLVALVAGKKIRVLQLHLDCAGTATVATLQSNATAIAGPFNNAASEQCLLPYSPHGWFETAAGEALKLTTGAGATTSVLLAYIEV